MNIFNNEEQKKERFQKRFLVLNEQLGDVDFFFLCVLTGKQATKCGFAPVTPDPNLMQPLLVGQSYCRYLQQTIRRCSSSPLLQSSSLQWGA